MDEHPASLQYCKSTLKAAAEKEAVLGPMDTHDHEEIKNVTPQTPCGDCSTPNRPTPEAGVVCLNETIQDDPGKVKTGANQADVACGGEMEHTQCPWILNGDAIKLGGYVDGNDKGPLVKGPGTPQGIVKDQVCIMEDGEKGDLSIIPVIEIDTGGSTHNPLSQNDGQVICDAEYGIFHSENSTNVSEPVNTCRESNGQGDHIETIPNSNTTGHHDYTNSNMVMTLEANGAKESKQVSLVSTATQTSSSQTQTDPNQRTRNPGGRGILVSQQNVDSELFVSDMTKQVTRIPICRDATNNVSQSDLDELTSIPHQDHVQKGIIKSQDGLNVPAVNEKPYLTRCLNCGNLQRVYPWTRKVSFSLETETESSDESSTKGPPNNLQHNGDVLPIADDVIVTSSSVNDDREELVESRLHMSRAPRDHLCLAVFGCLLSPLTGPCAIRYAVKSRRAKAAGDYRKASYNGQKALVLTIIGVCLMLVVVGSTLYLLSTQLPPYDL